MTWALLALLGLILLFLILSLFKQKQIQDSLKKSPEADMPLVLLQQQVEKLREQVQAKLDGSANLLEKQLGNLNHQLNERLKDSSQILQKSQESVGTRLDHAAKVVGELQGKLGKLEEANTRIFEVGKDIRSLQEILKSPKMRGSLGEYFLGDLLLQILPKEHFELQRSFKNNEKVDAAILIGEAWVSVDAKFPLENFQRFLAASDEAEKKNLRKVFTSDVKKHIDAIAQKYIRPDEGTYEFALMYVPAENIYYEIIVKDELTEGEHVLANHAMQKKVIPVSPNTLYIYLQTIALGLKGLRIEKTAKEILNGLTRLGSDLEKISEAFRKVGVHLRNAEGAFEDADGRLNKFSDKIERLHGGAENAPLVEEKPVRLLSSNADDPQLG